MHKNIGVLIYTYNRVDDARINMEFIKHVWQKNLQHDIKIVHAFNGEKDWYSQKYLEDYLVRIKNSWHFQGASDLIDVGIKKFKSKYPEVDYVIVLASDTWVVNFDYLQSLIEQMQKDQSVLATCAWGLPERNDMRDVGMAVDFFVVDLTWATKYKMFPVKYKKFQKKYKDLLAYQKLGNVMLEKLMLARYSEAISRMEKISGLARKASINKILIMKEREPVHSHIDSAGNWIRNMYWSSMNLLTHHTAEEKRDVLKKLRIKAGEYTDKLINSDDLSYYNDGTGKMNHNCN